LHGGSSFGAFNRATQEYKKKLKRRGDVSYCWHRHKNSQKNEGFLAALRMTTKPKGRFRGITQARKKAPGPRLSSAKNGLMAKPFSRLTQRQLRLLVLGVAP
jgi:hypothetical protein